MKIESYSECAEFLNERIKDDELKNLIFGTPVLRKRTVQGLGAIYKILKAQFLLVYLKWLNSERKELADKKSTHLKNVSSVLSDLYRKWDLELDVIIYVLTEAQKDVRELNDDSFFADVIEQNEDCLYGKTYSLLYDWLNSLQSSEPTLEEMIEVIVQLAKQAKGLASANWNSQEKTFNLNGKELQSSPIVYIDEVGTPYLLKNKTYASEKSLCEYVSLDNSSKATIIR